MAVKIILSLLFILLLIVVGVIIADSNRFVIRKYTLEADGIESEHTFLFISDQHCRIYGENNIRLKKALDMINAEACFMAGDMITAIPGTDSSNASDLINYISKKMPVFLSLGNHEYRAKIYPNVYGDMYSEFINSVLDDNIHILDNEVFHYEDIDIYGLTISRDFYKRFKTVSMNAVDVSSFITKEESSRYSVLLAHNPDYFDAYKEWGANLILSGHLHGGIARIPGIGGVISPSFKLFPKYDGGLFAKGASSLIVSRGLGFHSIPIRVFNPAEIILINLKKH